MKKTALLMFALAACSFAQLVAPGLLREREAATGLSSGSRPGAESIPFRVVLSPANEVPPVNLAASGTATVWLHVVRDSSGGVISGSVDFVVRYRFPEAVTFTGLHIHSGAAGANGPVVINSSLTRVEDAAADGVLRYQGQVMDSSAAGVAALRGVLENPAGYYVNLHTSVHPGGAIRGQMEPAQALVLMTQLSGGNEVPPVDIAARGTGTLMVLAGVRGDGQFSSAEVTFDVNYTGFAEGTNFTGLHIHTGAAGVNGPVTIDSALRGPVAAAASGAGNLRYEAEVNMSNAASVAALYGLFAQPARYYMNLHTQANPAGAIRGQMRNTDKATFQVTLLPGNEVPPVTGLEAQAHAAFTIHTLRNNEGHVLAGVTIFDVNFRFPGEVQFTGLHVHDGIAGVNGPVTLDSGLSRTNEPLSAAGFGNLYRWRTQDSNTAFQSMNSVVIYPERHYLNLHTTVNAPGAVRAQLMDASPARPRISAILSGVSHPDYQTAAPLGLITIFGSDLFRVPADSGSFEAMAPKSLNGTTVRIGGMEAAILTLGRDPQFIPTDYIVAQAPADLAGGEYAVIVNNSNGPGGTWGLMVDQVAPAAYFDANGGVAFRLTDMSLVGEGNPARAGEQVVLLMTGLGLVSPALGTGEFAPGSPAANVVGPLQVTVGGRAATGVSATAWPGFAGLYRVVFTVPEGVSGTVTVSISQIVMTGLTPRPVISNAVTIRVQ